MAASSCDSACSTARTSPSVWVDQSLRDAQDVVEQALHDPDLRISRARFYDISRANRADAALFYQESLSSEKASKEFIARVLHRVNNMLFEDLLTVSGSLSPRGVTNTSAKSTKITSLIDSTSRASTQKSSITNTR